MGGEEDNNNNNDNKERSALTPWEQHSSVISMPRFDYKAPSALLQRSHSGFLVTCTLKREKSATKEAISILQKCGESCSRHTSENLGCPGEKKRKSCDVEITGELTNGGEGSTTTTVRNNVAVGMDGEYEIGTETDTTAAVSDNPGQIFKDSNVSSSRTDATANGGLGLSLVKLTRSGLVLFTFPSNTAPDTVDTVSNIMQFLKSGSLRSPQWCNRIFPIQATCNLNEVELRTVVAQLVFQFMNDSQNKVACPIKFAVGYNRRGMEETEMKNLKKSSADSNLFPLMDRNKCFSIVAAEIKGVVPDSVVDLKTPELSVLVELLPISGLPKGSFVAAVAVLPHNLVSSKPRLCIKALTSDAKANIGKC